MDNAFCVVKQGKSVCSLITGDDSSVLARIAAESISKAVRDFTGVEISVSKTAGAQGGASIIIGTPDSNPEVRKKISDDLTDLGYEGYLIRVVHDSDDPPSVIVTGNTPRAVYYGAVYLADSLMSLEGTNLVIHDVNIRRSPALRVRGTYNLACWGVIHRYRREDWETIIDAMAEDSMNTVYFWLSGLFRSQKHPEAFTYKETVMTTEDIRQLIRYAHDRGIKFQLGSGLFAWLAIDALAAAYPETAAEGFGGMCPSSEKARQLNMEYLMEMYDTFPEADGFFLEMRDEYGECTSEDCRKPLDEYGSRQYGESEITLLQELVQETWKKHPDAILTTAVGYSPHSADVRYYETIRKIDDPRLHWLVVRGNWSLPGPKAEPRPLTYFSKNMIQWDHYYTSSIETIKAICERSADENLLGYCPAFEPGYSSASYYNDVIPFPVNLIPYRITRFAYRQFCWNPKMSIEEFRDKLYVKFFTPEIPKDMVDSLLALFDFVRTNYQWAKGRELLERIEKEGIADPYAAEYEKLYSLEGIQKRYADQLRGIEADILSQYPSASAKSKGTLDMMMRCIQDTKDRFCFEPADIQRLEAAISQLEKSRREAVKDHFVELESSGETKIGAYSFMCRHKRSYDGVAQAALIYREEQMGLAFDMPGELYDLTLTFRGVNSEKEGGTPTIFIRVNDHTVFDGPSPFAPDVFDNSDDEWSEFTVTVPKAVLKPKENRLSIQNVLSTGHWWMIDYMIVRKKE